MGLLFLRDNLTSLPRTKALVLELLAAVCLVRGGHDIILAAFDNFKEVLEAPPKGVLSSSVAESPAGSCGLCWGKLGL